MISEVEMLLEMKERSSELDVAPKRQRLNDYIEQNLISLRTEADKLLPIQKQSWEPLYEDHLEISLKSDIDAIIKTGTLEDAANFNSGTGNSSLTCIIQTAKNHPDKVLSVNVICNGSPPLITLTQMDAFIMAIFELGKRKYIVSA